MTEGLVSNAGYDIAGCFFDGRGRRLHPVYTFWFVFSWLDFLWSLLRLVDEQQMEILIDTMVSYISFQADKLDDCRLQLFLKWLRSHSSAVRNAEQALVEIRPENQVQIGSLRNSLKTWFESFSVSGLLWEYQLILTEIRWWRALDEPSLAKILKEDDED
jgi:hypothetical protein